MVEISENKPSHWHTVRQTTPEEDRQIAEFAPEHLKAHYQERAAMDPETRLAEFEARKVEAETKHAAEIGTMTDKIIEQRKIEERIADKQVEKEKVKRRREDMPPKADPNSIELEFAMTTDITTVKINYLLDPYLPAKCVVGFYGRGSSAKSSFVASMAAHLSATMSTLWVSVEEPSDWIKVRHIKSGGADATLQIVKAVATKKDGQGRTVGSTFNIYEHLEPAIVAAKTKLLNVPGGKPLRLVVLDTVVGLTTWAASAGPNSDEGVKKLLAYLQGLAEAHNMTIAVIGHANKGKHDHFADVVMGATAWTNSPRLSFVHAADRREDYAYVMRVAKTNLVTFGVAYKTEPVHTLYERESGPDSVLVKVVPDPIVWDDRPSMELWEDATALPKDEDEGAFIDRRKLTIVNIVLNKLVEMVHAGQDEFITREQVENQLTDVKINRNQWKKVDMDLRQFPFAHKVEITTGGGYNMTIYRPIPDEVPK